MQSDTQPGYLLYLVLAAIGAWAGLTGWWLTEGWQNGLLPEREMLGVSFVLFAFFTMMLSLIGPVTVHRTILPAAGAAVLLGGAVWWASGRHEDVGDFMDLGYPVLCFALALLVVTPFVAATLSAPAGWQDYPMLYRLSWRIAVRHVAAFVFTAMFWGIFALSDAVLSIVGLDLWDLVLRHDATVWALSGAVFGLALTVVHELREFISPYLVLRLLRLFVPVVLVVAVIFVVALPLRGWGGLLNGWSPAAALLAFSLAAVVLVTVSVDCESSDAAQNPVFRLLVAGLAVLVPVLAGLALWAVWLRVGQYGWTPERLTALTIGLVLVAYGAAYALAVAMRRDWMERIRQANIWLALMVVVTCLFWLSPLFSPEAVSSRSQLARLVHDDKVDEGVLSQLAFDWGHAGQTALEGLAVARPELIATIDAVREGGRYFVSAHEEVVRPLSAQIPVYPEGVTLPDGAFSELNAGFARRVSAACDLALPSGPGCGLFVIPSETTETSMVLFLREAENVVRVEPMRLSDGVLEREGHVSRLGANNSPLGDRALTDLHAGKAQVGLIEVEVIKLSGRSLFTHN